jgi:hypothetical protein
MTDNKSLPEQALSLANADQLPQAQHDAHATEQYVSPRVTVSVFGGLALTAPIGLETIAPTPADLPIE